MGYLSLRKEVAIWINGYWVLSLMSDCRGVSYPEEFIYTMHYASSDLEL